jgi:hypothetical protein
LATYMKAVGTENPFIGRKDQEIRIEPLHIHRQHPDVMRSVDQEHRVLLFQRSADLRDIDQPAIRPMHRRDRGQRQRYRARPLDRSQHGCGPVAVFGLAHGFDGKTLRVRAHLPLQDRRGVVVLKHEHAGAPRDRQELCRGGDAIADGGDQRDVLRVGIDQPCRGATGALVYLVGKAAGNRPRLPLAADRSAARFQRFPRQRTVGGGVEVADLARHLEVLALGGKHGLDRLAVEALSRLHGAAGSEQPR